jgi:hypothetical protein
MSTLYNLYFKGVSESNLQYLVDSYHEGKKQVTINGKVSHIGELSEFKIFNYEKKLSIPEFINYCNNGGYIAQNYLGGTFITKDGLAIGGTEVTAQFLGQKGFGEGSRNQSSPKHVNGLFISHSRIQELRDCKNPKFDLEKLIRICEEINHNFEHGNYFSVGVLGRAVLDHVPPIFQNQKTFQQVISQAPGSIKKQFNNLDQNVRDIADTMLHFPIGQKETLPNSYTIGYGQLLDVLLQQVIQICHK